MSEKMKNVPKRRFKEFKDAEAWEQRKLSELIIEYKETVEADCNLPVLTSSKTEGVILQEEHFGRKQNHDITGYNILPRNYCTYRNRSDGVDFTFNINKCCDMGIISKFYPVFCGNNSDIFFISLVLNNSEEVVREIGYTCTGTGQKVLSFLDLQKMYIRVPSYEEQKRIALYFENLDNLITLHQRELLKLQNLKKSYLSEMFPREGEKYPRRRFPGFTEAWEQRKLSELADFSKGQGYTKSDLKENGTPIILYGRLYTKYQTVIREVDTFADVITGAVFSKGGEVILPSSGETAEDIAIASNVDKSGFLLGGGLNIVLPHKELLPTFLAIELSFGEPHSSLAKWAQGKSVVHLYNEDLKEVLISFPTTDEQATISSYIDSLDNLITLHQRELEKLQNLKKAYLQDLFVS